MRAITWRNTGVYVLVVLPVLGLAGIAAIAQQQQQDSSQQATPDPVAEAARKAREQKKAEPKAKKVYTNEDVSTGTPAPAAVVPPAGTATPESKEAAAGEANGDKGPASEKGAGANQNTEEAWRKRFREARDKLAQAEQELDILQREAQKAQVQYYTDPQKALSEQYTRKDVNEKDTKIEAKKQEIAQMKQHIADMEDDLRKSGGDSGWAR
jgi:predicted RNase H-like nuclease (RuvC/YqgF family)